MTLAEFSKLLRSKEREVQVLMRQKMPVIVGAMGKSHFRENFRKGGFVNNGLHKWQPSKRIGVGTGAKSKYGTLLSSRMHLYNNVSYAPGDGRVRIHIPVPYAAIHQFGGTVKVPVTSKMRGYAWHRYYQLGGGNKGSEVPEEAQRWKRLALTRKTQLNITMPARPMIGQSAELNEKYTKRLDDELMKILNF